MRQLLLYYFWTEFISCMAILCAICSSSLHMQIQTIYKLQIAGTEVILASVEKKLWVDALHRVKNIADTLISDCAHIEFGSVFNCCMDETPSNQ
ncbi:unnamed protein product [Cuscuta campestris]|uniref:Uncharacterized protein n=1 Tax=Cuscuta campestris TaxID=132261 RepID=A0A484LVW3_9ASTE|nr:unnamed protein product [Cuscuta campestris]